MAIKPCLSVRDCLRVVLSAAVLCASSSGAVGAEARHGLALHGAPKYSADFEHFDYARPDAPKGGEIKLSSLGTFDSLNPFILKGVPAAGAAMVFSTLMEPSLDEPFSQYGQLAERVAVAKDKSWVSYRLRPQARFSDGGKVAPEDVIFSFETLRDKGHPFYRSYYRDVAKAEKISENEVKFTFKGGSNTELPLVMGQLPVLSKKWWEGRDFSATTLEPIVGSGPYRVESLNAGRDVAYRRVSSWWGENLPVNRGRYNFDVVRYDYYRDAAVALEAFFAGRYDWRLENVARNWAVAYDTPAVKQGRVVKREIANELPAGMQGFVFNTRREAFKDKRVREALSYAFDFEWSNRNLAYGAYRRTSSYFANSELAARGLPAGKELEILERYRGKIPDEVFTAEFKPPVTDGSGDARENLRRAAALLKEAGWTLKNGKLVDAKGRQFRFSIMDESPMFERWIQPFLRNLERLGIQADFRIADTAQHQNMVNDFDFDMIVSSFGQSLSPGNEQRDFWSSSRASQKGSRNLAGISDPVVDDLVDRIVAAPDRPMLVALCRALDRILLAGHYVIPHWHIGVWRVAYWDMFGMPDITPKYGLDAVSLWWADPAKDKKVKEADRRKR